MGRVNFETTNLPELTIQPHNPNPLAYLEGFLQSHDARVLLVADSAGRREILNEHLQPHTPFSKTI